MNPDDILPPVPAKKRIRNRSAKPVQDRVTSPVAPFGGAPPKPEIDNAMGDKTPAVIRWRLQHCPETMAVIYRTWNWQAWLDQNPE